jgi:hypothetical protein
MEEHMSFEQISEILGFIRNSHEQVRQFCMIHEFDFSDDQKQLLIAMLREDQERLQSGLDQYQVDPAHAASVDTWIQYVPQHALESSVERIVKMQTPSFDELVAAIGSFYQVIGAFIERIKDQAPSEDGVKILEDLAFLENQNAKALTERLSGLRDV